MKTKIQFLVVRLIRKLAKLAGYRVDFSPRTLLDTREAKAEYLSALCKRTAHLEGDIVECGLGHGFSFAHLAKQGSQSGKKTIGFDSFSGFPKPALQDVSSYAVKEGDWGSIDMRTIEAYLLAQVSEEYYREKITIVPGFFNDTLKISGIEKISFLHLDADLYQSYMDCLEALYAKVVHGGIIAFDECLSGIEYAKYPGGFIAIQEFFKDKNIDLSRDIKTGKYYIVKL